MKYLSLCSGIEAASVAWKPIGWEAIGFSEIEKFPCRLLKHHYPDVQNFGDMTKWKEWNLEPETVDLICGGTPCQSFSIAGLRKGMGDARGNLSLEYCRMAARLRPRWLVWENVPGVLSSGKGRDFGSIVGALAEIGYGVCWRVLDAQHFGVAQRRRRVWLVGHLGDWRPAAAVLFERESLRGDTAKGGKTGEEVAGTIEARARSGGWSNNVDMAAAGYMRVGKCLTKGCAQRPDSETEDFVVAPTLSASGSGTARPGGAGAELDFYVPVAHGIAWTNIGHCLRSGASRVDKPDSSTYISAHTGVRRLTPRECERLQGFPDDYTNIPGASDGARYKALGNSWAVPCARWIGERIQLVDDLMMEMVP